MPSSIRHRASSSVGAGNSSSDIKIASSSVLKGCYLICAFLLGCAFAMSILLHLNLHPTPSSLHSSPHTLSDFRLSSSSETKSVPNNLPSSSSSSSLLNGISILVAIASYDFSQIPHLEELLDSYLDACESGAKVNIFIHTTQPYPVPLIDLLNTRLTCSANPANFHITISLRSPTLRLHLVDLHRQLFYDNIDQYDLFVYTEDDIRVTPTTLASYLKETQTIHDIVGGPQRGGSDFNVGVVRYEYNYPPDVIIDDKTRSATKNVTRVYWEHLWKPPIPKVAAPVPHPKLERDYLHMTNPHQGMFLATRGLLKAWKDRPNCNFHIASNRPGMKNNPSQPSMGTQRVWMSSVMLYSRRYCNVQQVIPVDRFGTLTVHHLPNKNYRRVGKKGRIGAHLDKGENRFGDGTETFQGPDKSLTTAMEFHIAVRRHFRKKQQVKEYRGIDMVDEVGGGHFKRWKEHRDLVDKRMREFNAYVARGGILSEEDLEEGERMQ